MAMRCRGCLLIHRWLILLTAKAGQRVEDWGRDGLDCQSVVLDLRCNGVPPLVVMHLVLHLSQCRTASKSRDIAAIRHLLLSACHSLMLVLFHSSPRVFPSPTCYRISTASSLRLLISSSPRLPIVSPSSRLPSPSSLLLLPRWRNRDAVLAAIPLWADDDAPSRAATRQRI